MRKDGPESHLSKQGTLRVVLQRDGKTVADSTYSYNTWPVVIDFDVARHYNLPYLDTGLLYRAVGRAVEAYENAPDFEARAIAAAQGLDENDIEPEFLLSAKVGTLASKVAVIGEVRAALFDYQRQFALQAGGANWR